ncbi:hypothetical protein AB0A77_34800 [Streptomyces varsoviensis]|uniref:hypothetical protein n=1 Tax=Streptomyces varsoviensis TaxID=67373 RepID=UPI0033E1CC42
MAVRPGGTYGRVGPDGTYGRVVRTAVWSVPGPNGSPARLAEEGDALIWDARRNRPGW